MKKKMHVLFLAMGSFGALRAMDEEKTGCLKRCTQRFIKNIVRKEVLLPAANGLLYLGVASALNKNMYERIIVTFIGAGYGRIGVKIAFGEGEKGEKQS